jgi:hypothetical protein
MGLLLVPVCYNCEEMCQLDIIFDIIYLAYIVLFYTSFTVMASHLIFSHASGIALLRLE